MEKYRITKPIAYGAFSNVVEAVLNEGEATRMGAPMRKFAIKIARENRPARISLEKSNQMLRYEVDVYNMLIRTVDHSCTPLDKIAVKVYETFVYDGKVHIVMDRMDSNLKSFLMRNIAVSNSDDQLFVTFKKLHRRVIPSIISQVIHILDCLHKSNIYHLDLTADNLLMHEDGRIHLNVSDFNCASALGIERPMYCGRGFEAILTNLSDGPIIHPDDLPIAALSNMVELPVDVGPATDVWCVGALLHYLLFSKTPLSSMVQLLPSEILENYDQRTGAYKIDINISNSFAYINGEDQFMKQAIDFMEKCLKYNARSRATLSELSRHPFLDPVLVLDGEESLSQSVEQQLQFQDWEQPPVATRRSPLTAHGIVTLHQQEQDQEQEQ